MNKIKVSEKFFSCQGEAKFVGVPSVFLRTFGCNFRCKKFGRSDDTSSMKHNPEVAVIIKNIKQYKSLDELPLVKTGCDSYPSIYPEFRHLSPSFTIDEIVDEMVALLPNGDWLQPTGNDVHLVITGGEPLLGWQKMYGEIFAHDKMRSLRNVTFETNGTQPLTKEFVNWWAEHKHRITFTFSVSPKLSASGEKWEDAICPEIVSEYGIFGDVYLKFVVETLAHVLEAETAVQAYRKKGFTGPVYLMPVGGVNEVYDSSKFSVAQEAMRRGWRYSPRLHLDLYGNRWNS